MKRKSLPAILLSMAVIAGAMTIITDAYAQTSNTDRLVAIGDTTSDTNNMVEEMASSIESILDMIGEVLSGLTDVKSVVDSTAITVDSIDSKISMMTDNADYTAQLEAFASDISSSIMDVDSAVSSNTDAIENLDERLTASLSDAVDSMSEESNNNAVAIANLQTALNDINAKLGDISVALKVVEENVDAPVVSTYPATLTQETINDQNIVRLSDFFKDVEVATNVKELKYEFEFSCKKDVLVQKILIDDTGSVENLSDDDAKLKSNNNDVKLVNNPFSIDIGDEARSSQHAKITVDGQDLLNSNFSLGGDNDATRGFVKPTIFGDPLRHLIAGQSVKISAEANFATLKTTFMNAGMYDELLDALQSSDDDVVQRSNADLFSVDIEYIQSEDADCSISLDAPGIYSNADTVNVVLNQISSDQVTAKFGASVTCNDIPTRFTDTISVGYSDTSDDPEKLTTVTLTAGDDKINLRPDRDDSTKLGRTGGDNFPLVLESGALKIEATSLQIDSLVLQLSYETVSGNECKVTE